MDEYDRFVSEHQWHKQHLQKFQSGETPEQREGWLRNTEAECKAKQVQYIVRETTWAGYPAYQFAFPDADAQRDFVRAVYGDLKGDWKHTHNFGDAGTDYQKAFLDAAQQYLRLSKIECRVHERPGALEFEFGRAADQWKFQMLVDEGYIHDEAVALLHMGVNQARTGAGAQTGPKVDLE